MDVSLSLASARLSESALQGLTRDLSNALSRQAGVQASLVEQAGEGGTRGGALELGAVLVSFLSAVPVGPLIDVARSFFDRESSLELELERDDGRKLRLSAQNVSQGRINETLEQARKFFEDP